MTNQEADELMAKLDAVISDALRYKRERDEAVRLLRSHVFHGTYESEMMCIECLEQPPNHKPDCKLNAFLTRIEQDDGAVTS